MPPGTRPGRPSGWWRRNRRSVMRRLTGRPLTLLPEALRVPVADPPAIPTPDGGRPHVSDPSMSKRARQKQRRQERLREQQTQAKAARRNRLLSFTLIAVLIVGVLGYFVQDFLAGRQELAAASDAAAEKLDELGCTEAALQPDLGGSHLQTDPASLAAAPPEELYDDPPASSGIHTPPVAAAGGRRGGGRGDRAALRQRGADRPADPGAHGDALAWGAHRPTPHPSTPHTSGEQRMCGIIGYTGSAQVLPILLDGLAMLEYRGYDSAGVAVVAGDGAGAVRVVKREGKLSELRAALQGQRINGTAGLGHTRWATHGPPSVCAQG